MEQANFEKYPLTGKESEKLFSHVDVHFVLLSTETANCIKKKRRNELSECKF